VRDYLRDSYGAKDFKVEYGGKHPHLYFSIQLCGEWHSHFLVMSLTHDPVAAINIKAQEIRRLFGPPPPKEPLPRRSLNKMTDELQSSTAMATVFAPEPPLTLDTKDYVAAVSPDQPLPPPVITKVINPRPPKVPPMMQTQEIEPERYAARVSVYNDRCLYLRLPPKLVEDWQQGAEFPCSVRFIAPGHWTISHAVSADDMRYSGAKFSRDGNYLLLKSSSKDSWLQHGVFGVTIATAQIIDDVIDILIEGELRPVGKLPEPSPNQREPEMATESKIQPIPPSPIFKKAQPPTLAPPNWTQTMRRILEDLKQVERNTSYRLAHNNRTDRWEFSAPAISLDDDDDQAGPV
jgi:hypothetical protein